MHTPSKKTRQVPAGFRAPPKPKFDPTKLSERELRDTYRRNQNVLDSSTPAASFVPRLQAEQAAIEAQLENIRRTQVEVDMGLLDLSGPASSTSESSTVRTKRRILASYTAPPNEASSSSFTIEQAMEIERRGHLADLERKQKAEERRMKYGLPGPDEQLTRKEREQRIWTFMNYRPTDSDLEYEEDEEDEEDVSWLEDALNDELRNPNIVDPDVPDFTPEELTHLIRMDDSRIDYGPTQFNGMS